MSLHKRQKWQENINSSDIDNSEQILLQSPISKDRGSVFLKNSDEEIEAAFAKAEQAFRAGDDMILVTESEKVAFEYPYVTDTAILNDLAYMLSKREKYNLSVKLLEKALVIEPQNFRLLYNLGLCFSKQRLFKAALPYFKRAEQIECTKEVCREIGVALFGTFNAQEAEPYFRKVLELGEARAIDYAALGKTLVAVGKLKEALEMLEKSLAMNPKNYEAFCSLAGIKKFTERDIPMVEALAANLNAERNAIDDKNIVFAYFSLGKIYDDLKDYEKAFAYYKQANEIKNKTNSYKVHVFAQAARRYVNTFTGEFLAKHKHYGSPSSLPVFVVGMPRSGTTLCEQVLSSHSRVYGAGEVNYLTEVTGAIKDKIVPGCFAPVPFPENTWHMSKKEVRALADQYITILTQGIGNSHKVVNKLPANFQHVGLISLLFPNAKIIHCKRHPLDVFLSIYFQHFAYVEYSSDPSMIVSYYKIYSQLMEFWHQQLPGVVYDHCYEEFVSDPETKAKELLTFCGLPWEDGCLKFYKNERPIHTASVAQVRRKLYSDSMFKWKRYEKFLGSVQEALSAEIAEYEKGLQEGIISDS